MCRNDHSNLGTLSIKKLQSFLAVAKLRSFRKAAESLNRSQPAVSIQIDSLEKDLGVSLFDRTTRSVTLTKEGKAFHAHVSPALDKISAGLGEISTMVKRNSAKLRISCAPTISNHLLGSILHNFCNRHPNVEIELREAVLDSMRSDLHNGNADLGLGPEFPDDPAYLQEPVFVDEIVAVLPINSGIDGTGSIPLCKLAKQPLLVSGPATALWKIIDEAFDAIGVTPNVNHVVVHNESLIGMVRAGLGVTFLPRYVAQINWRDDYHIRTVRDPSLTRSVCFVTRADKNPSIPAENFKKLVHSHMPAVLKQILGA